MLFNKEVILGQFKSENGGLYLDYPKRILASRVLTPLWSDLHKLHNTRLVQYSWIPMFLIPVLAKMMGTLQGKGIVLFDQSIEITMSLPFSWQLLFLSSLCFAVASVVFKAKCPRMLQRFSKLEELRAEIETDDSIMYFLLDTYFECLLLRNRNRNGVLNEGVEFFGHEYALPEITHQDMEN